MQSTDLCGSGCSRAEAEALAVLSFLARKGAYALPTQSLSKAGGAFAVHSPSNGFARPVAIISGEAAQCAMSRGWLEREPGSECLRLGAAGVSALRRAKTDSQLGTHRAAQPRCPHRRNQIARGAIPVAVQRESPLAWLQSRKDKGGQPLITEAQFTAGERLGADYWRAQMMPRVTADWSGIASSRRMRRSTPGAGVEISSGVLAARERVHRALAAVGPELAGILVDVCCHDRGLEAAGNAEGWPQRAAKVVLQLALTRLARHYGLIAPEPAVHRLRHWGAEDFKPNLDVWV